jgi:Co/Zn/Cd efflux system component
VISAAMMSTLAWPLLQVSSRILLQTVPLELESSIDRCIREISTYDGVLECRNMHWWSHTPGYVVGTLIVRVRADAHEQEILSYVHSLLDKFVSDLTVQVEKDTPLDWILRTTH